MKDWTNRVAVVTGAASGIGRSLAEQLSAAGAKVVVADRDGLAADAVAASLAGAVAIAVDVADPASVDALAARVAAEFGDVDLLCNNAGVLRPGTSYAADLEDWATILGVNVMGVVHGLRSFVPAMLAHGKPCHVLNTASVASLFSTAHVAAYGASKAAVLSISEALALEVAGTAMSVTVLCPGGVATSIYSSEAERRARHDPAGTPEANATFARFSDPGRTDQMSPDAVAAAALGAVDAGELYALVFDEAVRTVVRSRFHRIEAAMSPAASDTDAWSST